MPYLLSQNKDGSYAVKNLSSGKIVAKHTTKAHAEAQIRLLHAIEKGYKRNKN